MTIEITKVKPVESVRVETNEDEYYNYTRYNSNCWFVMMGESDEPVYDCDELEQLYINYIKTNNVKTPLQQANERIQYLESVIANSIHFRIEEWDGLLYKFCNYCDNDLNTVEHEHDCIIKNEFGK